MPLSYGCNAVALTWSTGTPPSTVAAAIAPVSALLTIWKFDNATKTFRAYTPAFPQLSDLWWTRQLDAVFVCVDRDAALTRPFLVHPTP